MPAVKTHTEKNVRYSDLNGAYRLTHADRVVDAVILEGDWGPFWALQPHEVELIEARGKQYLPFNHATGKGYILRGLGLVEHFISVEDRPDPEDEPRKAPKGPRRRHLGLQKQDAPTRTEPPVKKVARSARGKRLGDL